MRPVSFQIAIMKVLASYPAGKASLADLKRDLAILTTSGPDWSARMKRLAARAPDLDAFSQRYLDRDAAGWWITASGRAFLEALERPAPPAAAEDAVVEVVAVEPPRPALTPMTIVGRRYRKVIRRRQRGLARLSA
jgi:hypothetical protein